MRFAVILKDFDTSNASPVVWWRVYSADGNCFDCGQSSQDLLQRGDTQQVFETSNTVFCWMRHDGYHRKMQFQPQELLPLISSVSSSRGNGNLTFLFDGQAQCHPSHFVLYLTNETSFWLQIQLGEVIISKIAPDTKGQEVALESAFYRRPNPDVTITTADNVGLEPLSLSNVKNGDSITIYFDCELDYFQKHLTCPIPTNDIPIRCINRSGQYASIVVHVGGNDNDNTHSHRTGCKADEPPFIIWLPQHPTSIQWSTKAVPAGFTELYKSGMTLTIRTPEAIAACQTLLEADYYVKNPNKRHDAKDFVELLEEVGELERCAGLFTNQLIEFWQLPLLAERDWERLNISVGSKIRIQHVLRRRGMLPSLQRKLPSMIRRRSSGSDDDSTTEEDFEFDVFISHKHEGGEDLAQAIKLQLQVMFPEQQPRIFLDVDNLRDLADLRNHVIKSRYFLLLLTPGVLERPYCQLELRTALETKKNNTDRIILVHDVKNCPFPNPKVLPSDLRCVLDKAAIPYHRELAFRETSVREIAKQIGFFVSFS